MQIYLYINLQFNCMEEQNPWWYGEEDYEYEKWKSFKIKWVPLLIDKIELKPFSLHFIVGSRQVGKTTAIETHPQVTKKL